MPLHESCILYRFISDILVEKVNASDIKENDMIVTPIINENNELIKVFNKSKVVRVIKHEVPFNRTFYYLPGGALVTKGHPIYERCDYDELHNRHYFLNGYRIKNPEDVYHSIKKKCDYVYEFILDNNDVVKVNESFVRSHCVI